MKRALRRQNFIHEMTKPSRCGEEANDRSRAFWPKYEQINRDFCPEDPVYSATTTSTALSNTADHVAVQAAANRQSRLMEVIISGEATSAAVARPLIARCVSPFAITAVGFSAVPFNSKSPTGIGTYARAGTQSFSTVPLLCFAFNALGGFIRWIAMPDAEIYYEDTGIISMKCNSGTSVCSSTFIFEEL